ncbi:MAG: hypothetical protein H6513_03425 [Acidimicrobiaceae bacterium]|nr:hypothetical protein [Acidimicrobiaceae bacterium]
MFRARRAAREAERDKWRLDDDEDIIAEYPLDSSAIFLPSLRPAALAISQRKLVYVNADGVIQPTECLLLRDVTSVRQEGYRVLVGTTSGSVQYTVLHSYGGDVDHEGRDRAQNLAADIRSSAKRAGGLRR